jgi:anaerobic magnesium-protoporphyrin IX monomethyl ester cyclase
LLIPPLAPALLKACLAQEGMSAITFDFNLSFQNEFDSGSRIKILAWLTTPDINIDGADFLNYQQFIKDSVQKVMSASPTAIGISAFSHESQRFVEDFCYHVKKQYPDMYIVVGGSGVSIVQNMYNKKWGDLMLESGLADCVLIGEGESMIADIIKNKKQGLITTPQMNSEVLNDLPIPNFDNYNLDEYGPRENLELPITSSKGCVRSCTFCDVASIWPKFRYRRGENVANEMIGIYQRYGIKNFAFTDSLINGGLKPFREMNIVLAERLPAAISYSGQFICRSKSEMPEKDFYLMKQGGCNKVSIGIESGSESVRSHMKKQFSNADIEYTVHRLLEQGIQQNWNIIVGYPTETDQDRKDTLDLIYRYQKYSDSIKINPVGIFQMLQHTPMTQPEMLSSLGIISNTVNGYSEYNWVSSKNSTNTLPVRAQRWHELVDMLADLGMLSKETRTDQKTITINQQIEYYEKKSNYPVFRIQQE